VLDPAGLGLVIQEVKVEGLRAGAQSVDFGQLFLGLSFFITAAALLLTALLFMFNVEMRYAESGLLLALGFPRRSVRRLVLAEGVVLVLAGGLIGCVGGLVINPLLLAALKTVWRGAVGTSALRMYIRPVTLLLGTGSGMAAALLTIRLAARKMVSRPVSGLQRGLLPVEAVRGGRSGLVRWIGAVSLAGAAGLLALAFVGGRRDEFALFFGAGTLLLIGGLAVFYLLLARLGRRAAGIHMSLLSIGVRGNARRRTRSLTLIGLLASGLFIVFTVGANRLNSVKDAQSRDAGTGGFALVGRSTVPILYDLDTAEGRRFYGLDSLGVPEVSFVQFRVKAGDDASCLNLHRVSSPQLLGVDPDELARRGAFRFVQISSEVDPADPWPALNRILPDGSLPAVADQTVIVWGLGKRVGDTLTYEDEAGGPFRVKLIGGLGNSIFQGNIILDERLFLEKYPSISGTRFFLVDAPFEKAAAVSEEISRALLDLGVDFVPAADRLAAFNQVTNTYLSIFLILGSLGLILGSLGIGIVVRRNIREREGELALLRAVGFDRKTIRTLVLSEFLPLLLAGIGFGLASALLAALPAVTAPGSQIPFATIGILLLIVLINGLIWTASAVRRALQRDLLPALRQE
jgi:putative ABC transport system permease protein